MINSLSTPQINLNAEGLHTSWQLSTSPVSIQTPSFNNAFCSRESFGFVLRLLMHTGCKSNHVQLSMLGSKYHQEHLWLVAGTVMAYLINSA